MFGLKYIAVAGAAVLIYIHRVYLKSVVAAEIAKVEAAHSLILHAAIVDAKAAIVAGETTATGILKKIEDGVAKLL